MSEYQEFVKRFSTPANKRKYPGKGELIKAAAAAWSQRKPVTKSKSKPTVSKPVVSKSKPVKSGGCCGCNTVCAMKMRTMPVKSGGCGSCGNSNKCSDMVGKYKLSDIVDAMPYFTHGDVPKSKSSQKLVSDVLEGGFSFGDFLDGVKNVASTIGHVVGTAADVAEKVAPLAAVVGAGKTRVKKQPRNKIVF